MPVLNFYVVLLCDGALSILARILNRCNLGGDILGAALSESVHAMRHMGEMIVLIIFCSSVAIYIHSANVG